MIAGDAIMLVASHRSRRQLLTGQLDPSVLNEADPERRDPALDLYDPANPAQPPYSPDFLATYRAAQIARNRSITAFAKDKLASLKAKGDPHGEYCFVVHRTMADPRVVNESAAALGRFNALRGWLSQWSYDDAQFDSVDSGPRISFPNVAATA